MPVKNAASTVRQAIESVLHSTFTDFEFVIVDDASTDDTLKVIRSIHDPRLRIMAAENPGLCPVLNQAVRACRAPYIARMDADDICYPHRFQAQLDAASANEWDVVGGQVRIIDREGLSVASLKRYESWVNSNLNHDTILAYRFVESPMANPTTLAKRSVYQQPFEDSPHPEDYDFWLHAMAKGFRFGKVGSVVLDWIDSSTRTTRNHPRYSPEAFDACRRFHLRQGPLLGVSSLHLWGAGLTGKPWLRWLRSEGFTVSKLIDVSPKKIGQTIHGTPVIPPEQLPSPDGTPLIVAVGARSAREQIESFLVSRSWRPGKDVWFVA